MHPALVGRTNLAAYTLGWLLVGFVCAGLMMAQEWGLAHSLAFGGLSALFASLFFFPVYYPCLVLRPGKSEPVIWFPTLAIVAAVFGAVWAVAMFLTLSLLNRTAFATPHTPRIVYLAAFGLVLCILSEAVYYIYIANARAREAESLELESRTMAREAELRALRAQLNPHFLFNSLNSISALTTADPAKARGMCVLLSDFLRKSLRLGECHAVSLSEELDLLGNYLAIEQIRFGSRLSVEWAIDSEALTAEIPTLLLQPLVENAIKHGVSQMVEGGTLKIVAGVREGRVTIVLENPLDEDARTPKGLGMGMRQVRQRLMARFGADGTMEVGFFGGLHRVCLSFPKIDREERGD